MFFEHGANLNLKDFRGETAMTYATRNKHVKAQQTIKKLCAKPKVEFLRGVPRHMRDESVDGISERSLDIKKQKKRGKKKGKS